MLGTYCYLGPAPDVDTMIEWAIIFAFSLRRCDQMTVISY